MEKWEIEHIKRNLKWLTKNTICNSDLTEPLIAKGIIKAEEGKRLENLLDREGIDNAAKEFYRILKENAEMVDRFLSLHVKMSGVSKPFREMFEIFCRYDALAILQSARMTTQTLSRITTIRLEQELPKPRPLYIPRSISNRRKLDKKVFHVDCKDVFVFKGVDMSTLEQLMEPLVVRLSSGQQTHVTCRHILLENDKDWDYMTLVCKHPMHLIGKDDGDFVLLRSTKVTSTVVNRLLGHKNNKALFVSEHEFVNEIMSTKGGKGALLCDIPGMGKTWFMENMALKIHAKVTASTTAVFYMNFDSLSTHLMKQHSAHDKGEEALNTLLLYACKSKLGVSFIQQPVHRGVLQLILLLDGFDEVPQKDAKSMISLLKNINEHRNVTLIITSRPNMQKELEETFSLVCYDIIPFDSSEQVKFISALWKEKHSDVDDDALRNLANQCVLSTEYVQRNGNGEILGVPLMCYILAENNAKFVKLVSRSSIKQSIQVPEIATITSVFDLYDTFVDKCFEKLSNKDTRKKVFKFHVYKALALIFPEISQCYLDANPELSLLKMNEMLLPGVLKPGEERNLNFIHRSFADYLAAKLFTEVWTNVVLFKPSINVQIQTYFIERVLATKDYATDYRRWMKIAKKGFLCFNTAGLKGITKIQVLPFQFATVLWFMENFFSNHGEPRSRLAAVRRFKKHISSLWFLFSWHNKKHLKVCKKSLRANAFLIVLACMEERYTNICGLVGEILKRGQETNDLSQGFLKKCT